MAKLETIKLTIGGSGDMDLDQITAREAKAEYRRIGHHPGQGRDR